MRRQPLIDQLRLATSKEVEEATGGAGLFTGSPGDIPSLAIFRILHDRFGDANDTPDPPKVLWEWALLSDNGILTVHDWKGGWSIGYLGQGEPPRGLVEDARILRDELVELGSRARLDVAGRVGGVIANPYRIFSDIADNLLEQVRDLKQETESGLQAYREAQHAPRQSGQGGRRATSGVSPDTDMEKILGLQFKTRYRTRSFLIAAMLAEVVSLEGFLNVIYHLFTKPELADDQIRPRLEREPLDLKLRLLDTFCYCFEGPPIDRNSELYKAFLHLVWLRHNFAHAKLTQMMDEAVVIEQGYPFLVPSDAPTKYGITSDPMAISAEMVELAGRIVRSIVRQIMKFMRPDIRYPFAAVHRYEYFQYSRKKDGKVRIVLGEDGYSPDDWIDEMLEGQGDEWQPTG